MLIGGGTLWINLEPHRVIMVSADHGRSILLDPLNHLVRSRAVIDQIAQTPEVIEALLWKGFQGSEIAVNIRNDGYLHEPEFPFVEECEG